MNHLLKGKVYDYLDSIQDLDNITLKDVINYLNDIEDLNISSEYFKNKTNKEQLKQIIINYRKSLLEPIVCEYNDDGSIIYKHGKFSKKECDLIRNTVNDYIKENDINISDLCSYVRDDDKRHRKIFKVLREVIPNRDRKVMYTYRYYVYIYSMLFYESLNYFYESHEIAYIIIQHFIFLLNLL